jgi:hypothetical protein
MISPSVGTARNYALVGFIFYVLSVVGELVGLLVIGFILTTVVYSASNLPGTTFYPTFPLLFIFLPLAFVLFVPGVILTVFAWMTMRDIDTGRYGQARTYSLILGIVGLFFGMLIGGIFFLLAHSKLSELTVQPVQQLGRRFCVNCGNPMSLDAKYCGRCGKEQPT